MLERRLRNRRGQACYDCGAQVWAQDGYLYAHHEKTNPPPKPRNGRGPWHRGKKHVIWVVRCPLCAANHEAREQERELTEAGILPAWWAE